MRMCEAVNHIFIVIVARARVPCHHELSLRTELHHALRHGRAREGASAQRARLVGLRADERVDKNSVIVSLRSDFPCYKTSKEESNKLFHIE